MKENNMDNLRNFFIFKINQLSFNDYMQLCYETIVGVPQEVLLHDSTPIELRIKIIGDLINYFSESEEYEKCKDLQEIQKILKKSIKPKKEKKKSKKVETGYIGETGSTGIV